MEKNKTEGLPFFTHPVRQIVQMLVVLVLVGIGVWIGFPILRGVFMSNPWLNGVIALVFLLGVLTCFWQIAQLFQSVSWIEDFVRQRSGHDFSTAPRLLAPLASLLRTRGARMQISSTSSRSILDSVDTRIDEARDITNYLATLLIFLGLLGTFYGLATTVPALVETIRALTPQPGESVVDVFDKLMSGLQKQLGGMGTAFSSSLLGLAGSLVVGLLELFAGHGQNRFYRELEEWLSSITKLGYAAGEGEGGGTPAMTAVLEQMSGQIEALQTFYTQTDISQSMVDERIGELAAAVARLATRLEADVTQASVLERIAEGQERLIAALGVAEGGAHADAESRMRLRSIDVQLLRILEEIAAGRQESTTDLRGDIATLTGAVRQLSRGTQGRG
ncbi:biopolymer transporter ExbB [Paracoccaceae bacterium Fryx2]|nr:biopolymer transporter ExbB [Paracoccaceae bacterium Fryx2]